MQSLAYSHRFALPLRYTTRMPMMRGRDAAMLRIPRASLSPHPTPVVLDWWSRTGWLRPFRSFATADSSNRLVVTTFWIGAPFTD